MDNCIADIYSKNGPPGRVVLKHAADINVKKTNILASLSQDVEILRSTYPYDRIVSVEPKNSRPYFAKNTECFFSHADLRSGECL